MVTPLALTNTPAEVAHMSPSSGDVGADPGAIENPAFVAFDAGVMTFPVNVAPAIFA
jgi:hypothetical protein